VKEGSVVVDRLVPFVAIDPPAKRLAARASAAVRAIRAAVAREGFAARAIDVSVFVRARYQRQSIELEVPLAADFRQRFDDAHRALFHSADPSRPLEVVGLRVSGTGSERRAPSVRPARGRTRTPSPVATASVVFGGKARPTAIFERDALPVGARIRGPAVVVEYSSTTVVAPGWTAVVDAAGNLRMSAT
jgi:N-methylhydantoinase A/oxoprolinase/acetone carboxylase beta subunit